MNLEVHKVLEPFEFFLGIGNPFWDRTVQVDFVPEGLKKGDTYTVLEKRIADQFWEKTYGLKPYTCTLGGSCTNVIKVFSRLLSSLDLQYSCSLLGMAGKDSKREIEENLKKFDVMPILIEGTQDNGIVNCFVTEDSQRTMQTFFGASLEFSEKYILPDHFKNISHVHLEGYLAYFGEVLEKSIKLAKEKEKGATISLDLSSIEVIVLFKDQIKRCAAEVDLIFGNIQEMEEFTGCKDVSEMIKKFDSRKIVVITDGSHGAWVKAEDKDEALKFDALTIDNIVDTTGVGDFFSAGFLVGWLGKKDIQTCIKIANLCASSVIQ